jgi:hypothetical protein
MAYVKDDRIAGILAELNAHAAAIAASCDEGGFWPGVRESALWKNVITQLPEYDEELTQRMWREDAPAFDLIDGTRVIFEHDAWIAQ